MTNYLIWFSIAIVLATFIAYSTKITIFEKLILAYLCIITSVFYCDIVKEDKGTYQNFNNVDIVRPVEISLTDGTGEYE
tara:strand:- start:385 stop:621 length:237 start_codon:yes stop_codon:yes gene_type:complete